MLTELKQKLIELDVDVLTTFIITLAIIFFGVSENVRDKSYQLKNILVMYLILFLISILFTDPIAIVILIITGFFAGGITLFNDKDNDLEKELGVFGFFLYALIAWITLVKSYIWFIVGGVIFLTNILIQSYGSLFLKENQDYIIIVLILLGTIYHYTRVAMDYYDFNNFSDTYNELVKIKSDIYDIDDELLSFVYYMEDKNLLDRRSTCTNYYDLINSYTLRKKNRPIFLRNIKLNDKTKKRFIRGFSTIEQQIFRNYALKDNSYRYVYRRKIFIEFFYNRAFTKALVTRRSKSFGRKKRKQKEAYRKLIWTFKLMFLEKYFISILGNPKSVDDLLFKMSKNSRVSEQLYKEIYSSYNNSAKKTENIEKIRRIRDSNFQFYK